MAFADQAQKRTPRFRGNLVSRCFLIFRLIAVAPKLSSPSSAPKILATDGRLRRRGRSVLAFHHHGRDDPRHLVCQRHPHQRWRLARQRPRQPGARARGWLTWRLMMTLLTSRISRRRRERSSTFVVAPRRRLPPVKCCRGTRRQGREAETVMAVAISGPMPGTFISLLAISFCLVQRLISSFELRDLRIGAGDDLEQHP